MVLRAHSKTVSGFYLLLFLQRIEIVLLYRSNQVDLGGSVSLEVLSNVIDRKAFGMQIETNMALNCIFSLILTVIKSFWVELISADFIYLEVHVNEESTASRYRTFSTLEQEVHFLRETAVCFTLLPWKFCVCCAEVRPHGSPKLLPVKSCLIFPHGGAGWRRRWFPRNSLNGCEGRGYYIMPARKVMPRV